MTETIERPIPAMTAIAKVAERLERGQQFNTYDLTGGGQTVCLGPVNDALAIADCASPAAAKMIEDALRLAAGQQLFDQEQFQ